MKTSLSAKFPPENGRETHANRKKIHAQSAFTMVELLIVLLVFVVMVAIIIPSLNRPRVKSARIKCVSNLKNIGLSFRIFATDHNDLFPWQTNSPSFNSLSDREQYFRHWERLANELSTPKLLICPSDNERKTEALSFQGLSTANVSYFLGINSTETLPESFLAGDRNITTNGIRIGPGRVELAPDANAAYDKTIHENQGNAVMGDGSVQQLSSARLREQLKNTGTTNTILLVP